jgi:DNA anti-recombination protein RmuC
MKPLSTLASFAAILAAIIGLIETIPALFQAFAYLLKNTLATNPQTLSQIVEGDSFLRGGAFLMRIHGMYALKAAPLFFALAVALAIVSSIARRIHEANEGVRRSIAARIESEARLVREREAKIVADKSSKIAAERNRILSMERLASHVSSVADSLPQHLNEAKRSITVAEREFGEGMLDPFWDAVESATRSLASFHSSSEELKVALQQFKVLSLQCQATSTIPKLRTAEAKIEDPIALSTRLHAIVRQSQRSYDFTNIFHLRRTNAILINGFTTFGQALNDMGEKIREAVATVSESVNSLESTVRDTGRDISASIQKSSEASKGSSVDFESSFAKLVKVSQRHSKNSEQSNEKIIDILDNIQRDRTPADLDYKPGTVRKSP